MVLEVQTFPANVILDDEALGSLASNIDTARNIASIGKQLRGHIDPTNYEDHRWDEFWHSTKLLDGLNFSEDVIDLSKTAIDIGAKLQAKRGASRILRELVDPDNASILLGGVSASADRVLFAGPSIATPTPPEKFMSLDEVHFDDYFIGFVVDPTVPKQTVDVYATLSPVWHHNGKTNPALETRKQFMTMMLPKLAEPIATDK